MKNLRNLYDGKSICQKWEIIANITKPKRVKKKKKNIGKIAKNIAGECFFEKVFLFYYQIKRKI